MKTLITVILAFSTLSLSAQSMERKVGHFKKVIASPKINLILVQGDDESVKINYANVDASKINVVVKHKNLHIYLDKAKYFEKQKHTQRDGWTGKQSIYYDATVTAYITYRALDKLVVRGEQEVEAQSKIENNKFKLSAYGECDITLASLKTDKFKASLYGEHRLKIKTGEVGKQKYKLFGENKIDAQALQSDRIISSTYGESRLKLNANKNMRLVTFGESNVHLAGNANLNKITLGEISVNQ